MATLAAIRGMEALRAEFPTIKFGVTNCRKISGSSRWSQHAWGNAVDIYFTRPYGDNSPYHQYQLDKVNTWLEEREDQLDIKYKAWRKTNHYDHIHIDFWPTGHLVPSCAGPGSNLWKYSDGLITGIYKLETEDEVPQFTEEEAAQLKEFLGFIKAEESNVGFVKHAIRLIRSARELPLHDHEGEVLIDKGVRARLDALLEKLRGV